VSAKARSVVYVVDRSASMGLNGAWARACREVRASLSRLPAGTRFQVIPYNRQAEPLVLQGSLDLAASGPAAPDEVTRALDALHPGGSTDHARALRRGLAFRPDFLFLLTDADDLGEKEVASVTTFNQRRTAIHTVELSRRQHTRPDSPLARLAADNRGTYRRVSPDGSW
jgi:hypothetical protein